MRYLSILFIMASIFISSMAMATNLSGSYLLQFQNATLTLTLSQDSQGNILGTFSSTSGMQYQVKGIMNQGVGVGACYNSMGGVFFEAHPQGNKLLFALIEPDANNKPDLSKVKQLMFIRQSGTDYPGQQSTGQQSTEQQPTGQQSGTGFYGGSNQTPGHQAQTDLERLLLSSAWCSFSYSGSSSYSYSGGTSKSSRVRFFPNGTYKSGSRGEGSSSGYGGTFASQHDNATDGYWKVQNGRLYMSEGSAPMEIINTRITYNSNGYPIIISDEVEYSQCE